jgi:hypothetical protein
MDKLSYYLFAEPSFVEGVARLIDLGGTLQEYNSALTEDQADEIAATADWMAVGDDLRQAMDTYAAEYIDETLISEQVLQDAKDMLSAA